MSNPTTAIKVSLPAATIGLVVFSREKESRSRARLPAKRSVKGSRLLQVALVAVGLTVPKAGGRLMRGPSCHGRAVGGGRAQTAVEITDRPLKRGTSSLTVRVSPKAVSAAPNLAEESAPFSCAAGMAGRRILTTATQRGSCENRREITRIGRKDRNSVSWSAICQRAMSARPRRRTIASRREREAVQGLISSASI